MPKQGDEKVVDSAIWTSPATTASPFAQLQPPANLDELAEVESKKETSERVKPYATPVTQETLRKQLK